MGIYGDVEGCTGNMGTYKDMLDSQQENNMNGEMETGVVARV